MKCNVCGEKIDEETILDKEPMGVLMFMSPKESKMMAMCPHCATNVLLYAEDLRGEFLNIKKHRLDAGGSLTNKKGRKK